MSEIQGNTIKVRDKVWQYTPDVGYCPLQRVDTIQDYEALRDQTELQAELIDGKIYMMAAPTPKHADVSGALNNQLYNQLKGKGCRSYDGTIEIKPNSDEDNVFIPDVTVICDPSYFTNRRYEGAPRFIAEITSVSTAFNDYNKKLSAYRKAGVREYWVIDPDTQIVRAYTFAGGDIDSEQIYSIKDKYIRLRCVADVLIDLQDVFAPMWEEESDILEEDA